MSDITLKAITDVDAEGVESINSVAFSYGDFPGGSHGKPITKQFAQELVNRNVWRDQEKIAAVTFNVRPLLLLLSQKDCVGIRYYYATNQDTTETIVLVGVDVDGNDLGTIKQDSAEFGSIITDTSTENSSIIIEVGGGNSVKDLGL